MGDLNNRLKFGAPPPTADRETNPQAMLFAPRSQTASPAKAGAGGSAAAADLGADGADSAVTSLQDGADGAEPEVQIRPKKVHDQRQVCLDSWLGRATVV